MTYISVVKKIKITIRDFFRLKFIYINFNMGLRPKPYTFSELLKLKGVPLYEIEN